MFFKTSWICPSRTAATTWQTKVLTAPWRPRPQIGLICLMLREWWARESRQDLMFAIDETLQLLQWLSSRRKEQPNRSLFWMPTVISTASSQAFLFSPLRSRIQGIKCLTWHCLPFYIRVLDEARHIARSLNKADMSNSLHDFFKRPKWRLNRLICSPNRSIRGRKKIAIWIASLPGEKLSVAGCPSTCCNLSGMSRRCQIGFSSH